jgi:hypothetical protein
VLKKRNNMPEFDFSGNFVKCDNTVNDSNFVIVGAPYAEIKLMKEKTLIDGKMQNKQYEVLNMNVEFDWKGKKVIKLYTVPDMATGQRFCEAWGDDFSQWNGKVFVGKHETYGANKKRVGGYPVNALIG